MRKIISFHDWSLPRTHAINRLTAKPLGFLWLRACLGALGLLMALDAHAENAPALLWKTNVGGARLFSVDAQANAYVSTNGAVVTYDGNGSFIQSNTICPLPGIAQRDASGNYYFSGSFDGTNDFGGIVLVGGCTNCDISHIGKWVPGWPSCYIAKYNGSGSLQWVTQFGPSGPSNRTDDIILNPNGTLTVGYDATGMSKVAMFSATGSNLWNNSLPGAVYANCYALTVSPFVGTNGLWLDRRQQFAIYGSYDASGNFVSYSSGPLFWTSSLAYAGRPVPGTSNDAYAAGFLTPPSSNPTLQKGQSPSTLEWNQSIGSVEQWVLAGDTSGNLYLGGVNGSFSKYDGNGSLIWSTNFGSAVSRVVANSAGDTFLAFDDGSIGRLDSPPAPPMLSIQMNPAGVEIHWSSKLTNYTLEAAQPGTTNWQAITGTPVTNGADVMVTNSVLPAGKLYRLHKQ